MPGSFDFTNFLEKHPYWILAAATLLIFFPVLFSQLWLIDDHEIVMFLTKLNEGGMAGFWRHWIHSPDFGEMPRFRPVYYVLRAFEILIWRDCVFLWSATRALFAFAFAASIFRLTQKSLPATSSLIVALSTLCAPWVPVILFRLGPAEAYAVMFVAMLIFALATNNGRVRWLAVAACIAALVGVKENFAILIPLAIWSVYALWSERKFAPAILASIFLMFSLACMAVLAYKLHLSAGVDVYNQSTGGDRVITTIFSLLYSPKGWFSLLVVCVFGYLCLSNKRELIKSSRAVWLFWGCCAVVAFNLYFYSGVPDIRQQYAFPYWPIIFGMLIWVWANTVGRSVNFLHYKARLSWAISVPIICLATINIWRGYEYAIATQRTDNALSSIIQKSHDVRDVIVIASGAIDYEPVISISRFLAFKKLQTPLFLHLNGGGAGFSERILSDQLLTVLHGIELNGGYGYQPFFIKGDNSTPCLEIVFQAGAPSVCADQVLVKYQI